jgi:hypothetical protein
MEELRAAFASEAGRATAADAANLQQLATVRSMTYTANETPRPSAINSRVPATLTLIPDRP